MHNSREPVFNEIDTSTPVLILNLLHHAGLGITRSLGRLGIEVHGVNPFRSAPGFYSRYFRGKKFIFNLETDPVASVRYLRQVAESIGQRALLIPTTDELTEFVADHRDALQEFFIFPALDSDLVRTLCSKKEMYFLAKEMSVPTAETLFPLNRKDVLEFMDRTTFPVMLKGIYGGRLDERVGTKMVIVHSKDELLAAYDRMEDPQQPNLMLQEYIPGDDNTVWMFNGYFNANSDCLMGMTGKKIRQAPIYTGYTSLGICLSHATVHEMTVRFMKDIRYRGILDIEYKFDERDGSYKVLDINPRIGATFRLFTGDNGLDVVRALYLDMTGQTIPETALVEGRKWMVEERDIISSFRYYRHGKLTIEQWTQSLMKIGEYAWLAADDLIPFSVMLLRLGMSGLQTLRKRGARPVAPKLLPPASQSIQREGEGTMSMADSGTTNETRSA